MRSIICALLMFGMMSGFSQPLDTIHTSIDSLMVMENIEFLYQRMLDEAESIADESEDLDILTDDFEDLLAEYEFCLEQPLNINSDEVTHLSEMGLITTFQFSALRQYRKWYGDLLYVEELLMVEGFDERTVAVIAPIVYCGKSEQQQEQERISLIKAITHGKHQIMINYAQKIEDSEAYDDVDDTLLLRKPNAYYLGSPFKLQLKYSYRYSTKLRFGFVMEKDAGEPLFFNSFSDTIQQLVKGHRSPGFDFYGVYFYVTDTRIGGEKSAGSTIKEYRSQNDSGNGFVFRDLVLGDYQLSFGQGLTLWSGMSFGKTSGGSTLMKRGAGVRPKASAGEGKFFRGIAATISFQELQATAFYSLRKIDATVVESSILSDSLDELEDSDAVEQGIVSALQESGYHRSLGELSKRKTLSQQVFGGHLAYSRPELEIGCTVYHTRLGAALQLKPSKYNQFYFQGDRLTVAGLDFRWQVNKAFVFGELSMSDNTALAGLAGITIKPAGYIDFTFMYWNYGKKYQNLFIGSVKESSRGQAEEGFYLGLQCDPAPRWNFLAHCDFFRFKWLTSQVYTPSWGQEYSFQLFHQLSRNATVQLKFKSKTKMKNSTDSHVFSYYPIFFTRRSIQFQLSYVLFDDWVFSSKVSYTHYFNDDGIDSRGHLLCQDLAYKPQGKTYSFVFRYTLFDSDDYNSRISIYENDVLGSFSIPNFFGRGSRVYLAGKLNIFNTLTIYAKVGCSFVSELTKTDVKAEVVWKF